MTARRRRSAIIALLISMALPAWCQEYLLYSPRPVTEEQKSQSNDGILVKEIEIQKGDTLFGISRKFSGKGMYYPQILLFNSLKSPDLIYPGNTLRVPVTDKNRAASEQTVPDKTVSSRKQKTKREQVSNKPEDSTVASKPNVELSSTDLKAVGSTKNVKNRYKKKGIAQTKKSSTNESPASKAGQKLFEAAMKAYRQEDCRTALDLLDRYLAENSNSPLAADATLYKAECFLKLSAQ